MSITTISILTYSALDHAKKCIASVFENSDMREVRLLLTANGSVDAFEYFSKIEDERDGVTVIYNQENEGFISPNRKALEMCDSEFFLTLNDDVEILDKQWLNKIKAPFFEFPTCAISGPTGGRYKHSPPPPDAIHFIEGSCMMGRTSLLKKVGLFSDYLKFACYEEVDLQMRLMDMGHTLHKTPFDIKHAGKTTRKGIVGMDSIERNNMQAVRRRFPQWFFPQ